MSKRQEILDRLAELGQDPKRSLGQNFLISERAIERIIEAARRFDAPALVEVGPGLGSLTELLLGLNKPLKLIELDRSFARYWRDRGLDVVETDALALDWKTLELATGTLLVSNLPYQISSSLVIERSLEPAGLIGMVLMFQKEVAQRLAAQASTKDYGLLTVIAQTFWSISTVLDAGPGDFFPPPKVASRVLAFQRKSAPLFDGEPDRAQDFLKFVKAAYAHRRKLMMRNLANGYFGGHAERIAGLEAAMAELELAPQSRAEELDPLQFVRLYERSVLNGFQRI